MENKTAEEKDAKIKISLRANSGYSSDISGKISLSQWEQINIIIDSGKCIPDLSQQLAEKDKEIEEIVIKAMNTVFQWVNIDNDNRVLGDVINDYLESLNK